MPLIIFILILSLLVLVHEWGHFITARRCGIKVDQFALGFGPKLWSRMHDGTEFCLCAIPLGGYVKMAGDERGQCSGAPHEFFSKSVGQRAAVIVMGPVVNLVLAYICFWFVFVIGYVDMDASAKKVAATIGQVLGGSPAEKAGLQPGDKIMAIDGKPVLHWPDLQDDVMSSTAPQVQVTLERNGQTMTKDLVPQQQSQKDIFGREHRTRRIGVGPMQPKDAADVVVVRCGPIGAFGCAAHELADITGKTYQAIYEMLIRERSPKEAMGIIGMFFVIKFALSVGFAFLLHIVGVISASLAIFNLLPLIPLDGGHLFLLLVEKVRGKALSANVDRTIGRMGFTLILTLALFIFYADFERAGWIDKITHVLHANGLPPDKGPAMPNTEDEQIKASIHHYLISKTNFLQVKDTMSEDQLRLFVDSAITTMCREKQISISVEERLAIIREVVNGIVSLGVLRPLVEDPEISEIMVNGPKSVYIQKNGRIEKTGVRFTDNATLMNTIQKILAASSTSRRVDESSPYVDFSMTDGSRVNVILPPCSMQGPIMTIRKFSRELTTVDDLIEKRSMTKPMAAFLTAAIRAKLNIVFCGSTGSGKTTLLNVLSRHIPDHERIVTIEDTSELRLMQDHVVSLQAKGPNIEGKGEVNIRDLFINSLRMRPDRIIIGEVRGEEILDLVQSITSGHSGSLAIVHADSAQECFNRMVTMMLMSGIRLSGDQIRHQIASSVDLIVYVELFLDGVRRVASITDLRFEKQSGDISLEDIFTFNQERIDAAGKVIGDWTMTRKQPSCYHKFIKRNVLLPDFFDEAKA